MNSKICMLASEIYWRYINWKSSKSNNLWDMIVKNQIISLKKQMHLDLDSVSDNDYALNILSGEIDSLSWCTGSYVFRWIFQLKIRWNILSVDWQLVFCWESTWHMFLCNYFKIMTFVAIKASNISHWICNMGSNQIETTKSQEIGLNRKKLYWKFLFYRSVKVIVHLWVQN